MRGPGAGLAASAGKVGAVATAFLFPIPLADLGTDVLPCLLAGASLPGALVTWTFRTATAGRTLKDPSATAPRPALPARRRSAGG